MAFTGDTVVHRTQTFLHEADPFAWLESLKKIGELEVDHIVPGHGEVCDKSYLVEQASFIHEWLEIVQKAIDQGLAKEQAMSSISLLDRYPMPHGWEKMGPEQQRRNVSRLYDVLSQR